MEFKGTKAPWKVINGWDKEGNGKYFPSVVIHGDEKQAKETLGRNTIVINTSHDQEIESLMANAKLIAAAPELLEALQSCVHSMNQQIESSRIELNKQQFSTNMNIAIKAINKALK